MNRFDEELAPHIDTRTEKKIYLLGISEYPKKDLEFQEWLAHKAEDVGVGEHIEYYAETENFEDDIEVHFRVELERLELTHNIIQL